VSIPVTTPVTGDGSLSVVYAGDLAGVGEFIDVSVEGTPIGTLNGGADCTTDHSDVLVIDAATFAAAASDGSVDITFEAFALVDNLCGFDPLLLFDPGGAFAVYNDVGVLPSTSFAVQGTLSYTADTAPAEQVDTTMMANRGSLILSHAPETRRRIERLRTGTGVTREALSFGGVPLLTDAPVGLDLGQGRMNFAAGADWGGAMVWSEGRIAALGDDATEDARFGILHVGVDWMANADTLIGVAAQIDRYEQVDLASGSDFSGTGWMIGPVVTARLAPDLYLDARLAYGRADNDAERGGATDGFGSERALAEIALMGETSRGAYTIFPEAEIAYFTESSEAYTSASLGAVDAARVALGQARLGALVERAFDFASGHRATAFMDFDGVYTHRYDGTPTAGSFAEDIEGWSGEAELGLRYAAGGGAVVDASVGMGGLFTGSGSYSATLSIRIPTR
jgi:hypothetical protein